MRFLYCLSVLFFFAAACSEPESTVFEEPRQAIEEEPAGKELTKEFEEMQEVLQGKTEEIATEIEAQMPAIEEKMAVVIEESAEKAEEITEEVKNKIPAITAHLADEIEKLGKRIEAMPIDIPDEVPEAEPETIPPQKEPLAVETLDDIANLPYEDIFVDDASDRLIAQNRWSLSVYNPEKKYRDYFDGQMNFMGRRKLDD